MSARYLAVTLTAFALAAACSNSEEAAPSRTVIPAGASSSGGPTNADSGVDANVDPSCKGTDDCFTCEATRSIDILNSCTDGTCAPFDNAARLPLLVAGQPLPAIP